MTTSSKLHHFFTTVRTAGFFKRLFSWKSILGEADDAENEYNTFSADSVSRVQAAEARVVSAEGQVSALQKQLDESSRTNGSRIATLTSHATNLETQLRDEQLKSRAAEESLYREKIQHQSDSDNAKRVSDELSSLKNNYQFLRDKSIHLEEENKTVKDTENRLVQLLNESEALKIQVHKLEEDLAVERENGRHQKEQNVELQQKFANLSANHQAVRDDLTKVSEQYRAEAERASQVIQDKNALSAELDALKVQFTQEKTEKTVESNKYLDLKKEFDEVTTELSDARSKIAAEESVKEEQMREYDRRVEALTAALKQAEDQRKQNELKAEELRAETEKELARTWQKHETDVAETMNIIAKRYEFNLCKKSEYPYPGSPDNVFLIGGMYTIFDAKSPKNPSELGNFPTYISEQAKHINKYIKHDDVRKDAFLVVPTNALSSLDTFMYQLEDCTVYVITLEAVLPILQMIRVLESYEFAEKLSPEDRDKICRFIGRLTHTAKRSIQIETFLSHEMIDALQDAHTLPEDFQKEVNQFDKKAVLNPPMERRAKLIKVEDVAEDVKLIENKIVGWSVIDD